MTGFKPQSFFREPLREAFPEPLHLLLLSAQWDALPSRSALLEPQGMFISEAFRFIY